MMGGDLKISNKSDDHSGTVFTLTLPQDEGDGNKDPELQAEEVQVSVLQVHAEKVENAKSVRISSTKSSSLAPRFLARRRRTWFSTQSTR